MTQPIQVTVWNEFRHEKTNETIRGTIYPPKGIHAAIADGLDSSGGFKVQSATLDEPRTRINRRCALKHGCPNLVGTRPHTAQLKTQLLTRFAHASWTAWDLLSSTPRITLNPLPV